MFLYDWHKPKFVEKEEKISRKRAKEEEKGKREKEEKISKKEKEEDKSHKTGNFPVI